MTTGISTATDLDGEQPRSAAAVAVDGTAGQQEAREHYAADPDSKEHGSDTKEPRVSTTADTAEHAAEGDERGAEGDAAPPPALVDLAAQRERPQSRFAYIKTRDFWIVLVLGQVLSLSLTGTNTFSTLLVNEGTSIPSLQNLLNYVLLAGIYNTYTMYRYGFRGYLRFLKDRGWKYFILSFCDVQGNYFTVLAYRYTTILSAQLINFWAIAMVVLVGLIFLRVRYHVLQLAGILLCIGGLGILFASDYLTGADEVAIDRSDQIKGDIFALVGATFYGLSNIFEEFLLSKQPLYEVLGQIGMWGVIILGVEAAIFDRASFQSAVWTGAVGGYLVGFTLLLTIFYSTAPLVFRMGSAAFFNISLLTSNFWGTVIGVQVFGYTIHYLYPIAFVCIIFGLVVYFIGRKVYGEAFKPWLGRMQERGISGVGTARRRAERPEVLV